MLSFFPVVGSSYLLHWHSRLQYKNIPENYSTSLLLSSLLYSPFSSLYFTKYLSILIIFIDHLSWLSLLLILIFLLEASTSSCEGFSWFPSMVVSDSTFTFILSKFHHFLTCSSIYNQLVVLNKICLYVNLQHVLITFLFPYFLLNGLVFIYSWLSKSTIYFSFFVAD